MSTAQEQSRRLFAYWLARRIAHHHLDQLRKAPPELLQQMMDVGGAQGMNLEDASEGFAGVLAPALAPEILERLRVRQPDDLEPADEGSERAVAKGSARMLGPDGPELWRVQMVYDVPTAVYDRGALCSIAHHVADAATHIARCVVRDLNAACACPACAAKVQP